MGQAQMSKNSDFWEILQLEIRNKNYVLNFFHAKYLLKYSFLLIQQFNFIIFLFFELFFKWWWKPNFMLPGTVSYLESKVNNEFPKTLFRLNLTIEFNAKPRAKSEPPWAVETIFENSEPI